jgi:predicted deacylase
MVEVFRKGRGSPRLLVVAGIHGDELNGVEAAGQIINDMNPEKGTLSVIEIANPPAYDHCSRENPDDGVDLNRCFPGEESTPSGRIAMAVFEEVKKADVIVDLHTGSRNRLFAPHVRLRVKNERQKELATATKLPVLIEDYKSKTLQAEAIRAGVPTVTIEAGEAEKIDPEYVEATKDAVKNLMVYGGMLSGKPAKSGPLYLKRERIRSPVDGTLGLYVGIGDRLKEGQLISGVNGVEIFAPFTGTVLGVWTDSYIKKGEVIANMVKDITKHELARTHLKSARYREAIRCYEEILSRDPLDDDAWLSMGGAYRALGGYEKAIECYDKAIGINPGNDDHWYYRGKAFARLSQHEEALKCFDRVLELTPTDEFSWISKAKALKGLGKGEESLKSLERAIEINDRNEDSLYLKAQILNKLGRAGELKHVISRLLEINPKHQAREEFGLG